MGEAVRRHRRVQRLHDEEARQGDPRVSGGGVDVAFEAVGKAATQEEALN